MDDAVLAALRRWPDVPAVAGWLSLDARGRWRLHPGGDAADPPFKLGELIGNAHLRAYIDRNYSHDTHGLWFFQNGPQRVYVRLDAAPYVIRLADDARVGDERVGDGSTLRTHTGLAITAVTQWLVDDLGHLYLDSALGAGRIDDRDLAALALRLVDTATTGGTLLDALERDAASGTLSYPGLMPAPWRRVASADIPALLQFVACPENC